MADQQTNITNHWLIALEDEAQTAFGFHKPTGAQRREYVDAHLSAMLAVAIGWDAQDDVQVILPNTYSCTTRCEVWTGTAWMNFSIHDESVMPPVTQKYGLIAEQVKSDENGGEMWAVTRNTITVEAPEKNTAVAILLIELSNAHAAWSNGQELIKLDTEDSTSTVEGFECKASCGRTYFISLEAVRQDYAAFLREQDGLTEEESLKEADENADFLETWFCEQFNWDDIAAMGELIAMPTDEEIVKALNFLRSYAGGGPSSEYKRVHRAMQ